MFEQSLRVIVADDHAMIAAALRKLLEPNFTVVDVVENGVALLEAAGSKRHDVIVTDIGMPDLDGLEATRELKRWDPATRVLILSVHTDPAWVRRAFEAGASGYLAKSSTPGELETALREISKGGTYVSPSVARSLLPGIPTATAAPIRVLVVDDHAVARMGIVALCRSASDIEIVGEADDGHQAIAQVESLRPDVVLMDLHMPEMDGVEAIRKILARHEVTRILLTTASEVNHQVLAAIRAGAVGYQNKCDAVYVDAIRRAHRGETVFPPELTAKLEAAEATDEAALTSREIDTTRLVAEGLGNKEIAQRLGVSIVTVRTHLSHIFRKLGLSNRVELALYAVRTGAELCGRCHVCRDTAQSMTKAAQPTP